MIDLDQYITNLRQDTRKYLEEEISSGRLSLAKGQLFAKEIGEQLVHGITDPNIPNKIATALSKKYPELNSVFYYAFTEANLAEKRRIVDTEIMDLINLGQIDQALSKLLTLKK